MQHMAHSKRRRLLWLFGVVIIGIGLIIGFGVHQAQVQYSNQIYTGRTHPSTVNPAKPLSILLLGTDTGADGRITKGNSDTMMVVTINPQTKKTVITSIPRDTLAQMVGTKSTNVQKLNAAYNIGGSTMAKASVSRLLNVPIDYYATINMGGLKQIVDAVGGVTITSPMKVSYDHITITKGRHHLNGKQALTYTRMRYQDPRGDYGRQLRQQQVMRAVLTKLAATKTLTHYNQLLSSLKDNLRTDLSFDDLLALATKDHANTHNIQSHQIIETPAWINTSSYQIASTAKLQATSDALRKQLGLQPEKINNLETKLNALNPNYDGLNNLIYNTAGLDTITYTE